jgi:Domain of unknown function (DUF4062)
MCRVDDAPERLVVDLSRAPPPDDAEVRAWAAEQSVFISSVMVGMKAEREAVAGAVHGVGSTPIWFETFGGMDDDPEDAYQGKVATSDIYVGILGARYGKPLKSGYSATHAEYNEAVRRGLRISVWAAQRGLDGPQRDFLEAVRVFHTTGSYESPDQLAERVEQRLREVAAGSLTPWTKVGNTLFRATNVIDDGTEITIAARIRDNTVAAALEAYRPAGWARQADTRITWPNGTSAVRVSSVVSETGASNARRLTITGTRIADSQEPSPLDMSFGERSPEDLTELAMRVAFFGEPNPLGAMSFMATATNPLRAIEGLGLSEDSIEQVAALLVTEELVATGRADHITSFQLGPKRLGRRPMALAWMPKRRYVNVDPEERRIEGEAQL